MCLSRPCLSSPPSISEVPTCWPRCLPPLHRRFHSALLVCRERYCGNPHKDMSAVQQGDSGNDFWGRNNAPLLLGDIVDVGRCILSRSVPALYSTCTGLIVVVRLGLATRLIDPSRPLKERSGEWWTRWELHLLIRVRASCIFQEQSSSRRP